MHEFASVSMNVSRNRVATVDVDFKFGVNRHSGSRICYAVYLRVGRSAFASPVLASWCNRPIN
jgi:hypothetical protein